MVLEINIACHHTLGLVLVSQACMKKVVTCDQFTKEELGTNTGRLLQNGLLGFSISKTKFAACAIAANESAIIFVYI